jgi:cytochrome b6-f complex iron-sulfur subunit
VVPDGLNRWSRLRVEVAEDDGRRELVEEPTRRAVVVAGMAAGASLLVACSGGSGTASGGGSGGSGAPIVVAQPTAGTAVAFSAICTHMACQVAPAGKRLDCPCHGSQYDATTGAVLRGPATKPLPAVPVRVENGKVVAGSA